MQTIQFQIEDSLYNEIVKKGINIQDELKLAFNKILYKKEYQMADEIKQAFDEVKQFKDGKIDLTNADDFLSELKSGH